MTVPLSFKFPDAAYGLETVVLPEIRALRKLRGLLKKYTGLGQVQFYEAVLGRGDPGLLPVPLPLKHPSGFHPKDPTHIGLAEWFLRSFAGEVRANRKRAVGYESFCDVKRMTLAIVHELTHWAIHNSKQPTQRLPGGRVSLLEKELWGFALIPKHDQDHTEELPPDFRYECPA